MAEAQPHGDRADTESRQKTLDKLPIRHRISAELNMGVAWATPRFIRGSDPNGSLPSFLGEEAQDGPIRRFH